MKITWEDLLDTSEGSEFTCEIEEMLEAMNEGILKYKELTQENEELKMTICNLEAEIDYLSQEYVDELRP